MKIALYVPCFNSEKSIGSCLEAIFLQTVSIDEVVVVDDGSTDATCLVAQKYPVKLIKHDKNKGLAAARNTAVRQISADLVASLDADCRPDKDWLEKLISEFDADKVAGAGGRLLEANTSSNFDLWRSVHMDQSWGNEEKHPSFLFGSNTVFRREALADAGFYDESFTSNYEDVDICQKLKSKGYLLKYKPGACVMHLKKDNLHSLFDSYWKWNLEFYRKQKYYTDEEKLIFKLKDNLGLANKYFTRDLIEGRRNLLYLDLLLALHHSVKDLEYYLAQANESNMSQPHLSLWLSLIDLLLFFNLDSGKDSFRALIKKNKKIYQNLLALNLVIGLPVVERFSDKEFGKLLHKHLLFSVYKINDGYLADKISDLLFCKKEWNNLYAKNHPLLDASFLKNFYLYFSEWLGHDMFNRKEIIASIKETAQLTEREI